MLFPGFRRAFLISDVVGNSSGIACTTLQGVQIASDVREVRLRAGDVLLLDTGTNFEHRYQHDKACA